MADANFWKHKSKGPSPKKPFTVTWQMRLAGSCIPPNKILNPPPRSIAEALAISDAIEKAESERKADSLTGGANVGSPAIGPVEK
jgi:hypothetical protein